ncbi:MAG: hypothetical protein ACYC2R_11895 [Burkholderiales bacterium]
MSGFTQEQLRQRAFARAAWVLRHFWEEQQDDPKREASVHTRLFDSLVPRCHIEIGKSKNGGGHIEHLVPCVMLRDHAFKLFWKGKDENKEISEIEKEVAEILNRFLRIAHITPDEARRLDHKLGLKTRMPDGWNFDTGLVMARLEAGGIELLLKD